MQEFFPLRQSVFLLYCKAKKDRKKITFANFWLDHERVSHFICKLKGKLEALSGYVIQINL